MTVPSFVRTTAVNCAVKTLIAPFTDLLLPSWLVGFWLPVCPEYVRALLRVLTTILYTWLVSPFSKIVVCPFETYPRLFGRTGCHSVNRGSQTLVCFRQHTWFLLRSGDLSKHCCDYQNIQEVHISEDPRVFVSPSIALSFWISI